MGKEGASQVVLVVKKPPFSAGDLRDVGSIPGWKDPLEEEMATHSSILAWRTPWTEEPAGYSLSGQKESDMTKENQHTCRHIGKEAKKESI